jgi:hypothetical protein
VTAFVEEMAKVWVSFAYSRGMFMGLSFDNISGIVTKDFDDLILGKLPSQMGTALAAKVHSSSQLRNNLIQPLVIGHKSSDFDNITPGFEDNFNLVLRLLPIGVKSEEDEAAEISSDLLHRAVLEVPSAGKGAKIGIVSTEVTGRLKELFGQEVRFGQEVTSE